MSGYKKRQQIYDHKSKRFGQIYRVFCDKVDGDWWYEISYINNQGANAIVNMRDICTNKFTYEILCLIKDFKEKQND